MHRNTMLDNARVHLTATQMIETALLYGAKPLRTVTLGPDSRIEIFRLPQDTLGSRKVTRVPGRLTEQGKVMPEHDEAYCMPFSVPQETTDAEFVDWYTGREDAGI